MNSNFKNNISNEEKMLLEEWINQIEKLKNEIYLLKEEGQCEIILSNVFSKLGKIQTGIQLWKLKNLDNL
jgi:hypothetical protein